MNNIDKNIINLVCDYLEKKDLDSYRLCGTYASLIVGANYFKNAIFNITKINKKNSHKFRYLVHKYKLLINIINIRHIRELIYLKNYNINNLTFDFGFNQEIIINTLPELLRSLTFGQFNKNIGINVLPASLQKIRFGYLFNQEIIIGVLPLSLVNIEFGSFFNQKLTVGVLPPSLLNITFGHYFNQEITVGVLPTSLISLTFGYCFNQKLTKGILPASLVNMTFSSCYSQELNMDYLPTTLRTLTIRMYNNVVLTGTRPKTLKIYYV